MTTHSPSTPGREAAAPVRSRRRLNFTLISAALFMFFVTWSLSWSLFSIWLTQDIGLSAYCSSSSSAPTPSAVW